MDSHALLAAISADTAQHISFLQALTRAASPNPPGDTTAAAAVITTYLASHTITPETIAPVPSAPNIVHSTSFSSPGPRLIFNGHIDVFPAGSGSDWTRDPWSGDLENGRVHGRGTVDMKAGTAASVIVYAYLHRYRNFLKGSMGLCAVSDEETGGKYGSKFLLEDEMWRGDCMINAEPGGVNTIRFAEKGTLRLTFDVETKGAHGAYTHLSKSATRIAALVIVELAAVEELEPELDEELVAYLKRREVGSAIDGAMGRGAADIMLTPTLNIGTLHGGLKVNMIPSSCTFEADIRLPIGLSRSTVLSCIDTILSRYPEVTMQVQEAASNPSASSPLNHRMVDILARSAVTVQEDENMIEKGEQERHREKGEEAKEPVSIPSLGATDCKFWRYKDVPAFVYGVSPEGMAARDESVSVDEFLHVVKAHVLAGWEFLGGKM